MGSLAERSVLMICGDFMEDYEAIVPYYALQSLGVRVDTVSPNKKSGDKCITAVHEYMGYEIFTELPGHFFNLNSSFNDVEPTAYNALVIPGGRFTELLSVDGKTLRMVSKFAKSGKPIATTCHGQLVLVSAGIVKGKKCTAFPSMKPVIELAGGIWLEPEPITSCFVDGNIITGIGWPAHSEFLSLLLRSMRAKISASVNRSVLFICGDYVEDYEANVPFRTLAALGCKVDVISPNKKKGETCITAIHDFEGAQTYSEKPGHYFVLTSDFDEYIHSEDYDCLVIPGGRSPEYLSIDDKVISLVKEFGDKNRVVSGIGQGQLVLAAAGLLQGKRCASGDGMKIIAGLAGGKVVEGVQSMADGNLVTATGWHALPDFMSDLIALLGIRVVF